MSISQLDDPSMREALGIETDNPSVLTPPVVIGSVTLADDGGGLLEITQTGAFPAAGGIRLGDSPLNANFCQITPNGLVYSDNGTGTSIQVLTWDNNNLDTTITAGSVGPASGDVVLQNAGTGSVVSSFGGVLDGTQGHTLSFTGSSGRLYMTTDGQFAMNHLSPATKTGTQLLFRPSYAQAISVASTPVGGTGQVILPITSLTNSSSAGGQPMWGVASPNLVLSATYGEAGVYLVSASIQLDTATAGVQTATAHFKINGNDVINTASRHTINQNGEATVTIQDYLTLAVGDAISVALSSTDAAMTATTYPASGGPPSIPQAPAVVLSALRIA